MPTVPVSLNCVNDTTCFPEVVAFPQYSDNWYCGTGLMYLPPNGDQPFQAGYYGDCSNIQWNLSTYAGSHDLNNGDPYEMKFETVYLEQGHKYSFGFTKIWPEFINVEGPGNWNPFNPFTWFDNNYYDMEHPDGHDIWPDTPLQVWDVNFTTLDFVPAYNSTTLFVDSETPNNPQDLCDRFFLDPCCTQPATGSVALQEYGSGLGIMNLNSNGQMVPPDCYQGDIDDSCNDVSIATVFWPTAFEIPVISSGITPGTVLYGPLVDEDELDCIKFQFLVFNRWGGIVFDGGVNERWMGNCNVDACVNGFNTEATTDEIEAFGFYPVQTGVYTIRYKLGPANSPSWTIEGDTVVTILH
jgi:hypothetical protein